MRVFYKKRYTNYEINNQFSLFFFVASNLQSVHHTKLINLMNKNSLEKGDLLFIHFNKFVMNQSASLLGVMHLTERTRDSSSSTTKKFKNIKIKLGTKTTNLINEKILLHLAFVWNLFILGRKTSCKILSYFGFDDSGILSYNLRKKSFVALYKFKNLQSLFLASNNTRKKLINFSHPDSNLSTHTIHSGLIFEKTGQVLNKSFYMLLSGNEKAT